MLARTISRNSPCATLTPDARVVLTDPIGWGTMASATAAAHMQPRSCAGNKITPRTAGSEPVMTIPRVTAGLNSPPEMRYMVHTATSRLMP